MLKMSIKPPTLQTKKLWVGSYSWGGGINVVFFKEKPRWDASIDQYDTSDTANIAGAMWDSDVNQFFTVEGGVERLYTHQGHDLLTAVIEIEVTAPFDEYGYLQSIPCNADGVGGNR